MEAERARIEAIFRQCVDESGVTASKLAREAGLAPSTITRFLAGKVDSIPTSVTVAKVQETARRLAVLRGIVPEPQPAHPGHKADEELLLIAFRQLSQEGRDSAIQYVDFLLAREETRREVV